MDPATAGPVVLDTLTRACSQTSDVFKLAEQQLKEWEVNPGFYSILMTIFSDHSIGVNVRWLAVLYFKNGIDRYWRRNAPNAIPEEEKGSLRQRLITHFNEPVPQIATQLAVLIGKVARLDCPRQWPELIPTLFEAVKQPDETVQQRALLTLYHVSKTLASKRLAADRRVFEELTKNIFSYVLEMWNCHSEQFFQAFEEQKSGLLFKSLDNSLLTLKVLRKLVVFGFKDPQESEDAMNFMRLVFNRMHKMLECKRRLPHEARLFELRDKSLTLMSKVLLDVLENHPDSYIQFIQPSLELVVAYNFTDTGAGLLFERFTVNCFNIIKKILMCENFKPARHIEDTKPSTLVAYKIKMAFFNTGTLSEMLRRLVSHYFLLTSDDLQIWDNDPEEYVCDEGGDSWKFSIRPCTEVLFLTLFKEFREILTPVLLEMVKQVEGNNLDPADLTAVLKKDAVYNAVGLASFDLFDEIDFDNWFTGQLVSELQQSHSNFRIIRRRVIWLIGQWVGVKFSLNMRPALYEVMLPLLKQPEDLVVRLETASTLKAAVDDIDFNTEQFMPYLEPLFGLLFQLLKEVSECETKMQVLHVLSFVVERVGYHIRPHATALVQYLPLLWEDSEHHNMLRCAILTTLVHLVQGLGKLCVTMYSFLLPVIQLSTDVHQEPHVYLLEDGLELWLETLHNSPAITQELLQIHSNMSALLEMGTENLRTCLKIIEAYLMLGATEYMEMYAGSLVSSLSSLLTDLKEDGVVIVMRLIELIFKTFPSEGPQIFSQMLPKILKNILNKEEISMIMSVYLSIVARMLLQNQNFFWNFLEHFSQSRNQTKEEVLGELLDIWFDRIDNMADPDRRKLSAMAVASLIPSNISCVHERFGGVINLCVEILHDVCSENEEGAEVDGLVILEKPATDQGECELETEHDRRKRELSFQDPVRRISLIDYLQSQLHQVQRQHGQSGFQQLIDLVDKEVYEQLQRFIK